MTNQQPGYKLYLLRLWQAHSGERLVWRASLEDVRTGERRGFGGLSRMLAFLEDQLDACTAIATDVAMSSAQASSSPSDGCS